MSSGSESDDDYVPGEPEQLSEEESANEETEQQYEKELDQKIKKRKIAQESTGKKKRKTRNGTNIESESPEKPDEIEASVNPEEDKKKEDDLWAMFLEGTDTKPKAAVKETSSSLEPPKSVVNKDAPPKKDAVPSNDDKAREQRIFEFAGETIVVENNKIKEKIKTADSPATSSKPDMPSRRPGGAGGLSSVLGQLNKKNKLSTLEKSKLDWSTYKQDEGIEEEIQSHNKGRNGQSDQSKPKATVSPKARERVAIPSLQNLNNFLERRDFLERADARQYEIERDLRMNRRSNR